MEGGLNDGAVAAQRNVVAIGEIKGCQWGGIEVEHGDEGVGGGLVVNQNGDGVVEARGKLALAENLVGLPVEAVVENKPAVNVGNGEGDDDRNLAVVVGRRPRLAARNEIVAGVGANGEGGGNLTRNSHGQVSFGKVKLPQRGVVVVELQVEGVANGR